MSATLTQAEASELFRAEPGRHIDVGAGEVAYRTVGSGPDVLFVHGWPVTGATWRTLLPHLVDHVTCHIIDFPGTGSSRFTAGDPITVDQHIKTLPKVLDALELDSVAVVGHDSGGMIARHAFAGDTRMRALGLIDTEQPQGLIWRFKQFLVMRHLPGFDKILRALMKSERLRRQPLVLGGSFHDKSLLDGEFNEFFLQPIVDSDARLAAATDLLDSFEMRHVNELAAIHARIDIPVHMVWGKDDPFFPLEWAREMVDTFANAELTVLERARLFSHEERPAEAAAALLPTLTA